MQTRAPSIKTLMQLKDMTIPTAQLIRKVIKADREALLIIASEIDQHKRELDWQRYNYINHSMADMRSEFLDRLLGTHGVEYLYKTSEGLKGHPDTTDDKLLVTYCNAGDPYTPTLLRYHGRWQVSDWGKIAERYL
jgi:hypothetical protein